LGIDFPLKTVHQIGDLQYRIGWGHGLLLPVTLPHHRTCGLPHPAVEPSQVYVCIPTVLQGMMNPYLASVLLLSA
jgi:hypothetical protein